MYISSYCWADLIPNPTPTPTITTTTNTTNTAATNDVTTTGDATMYLDMSILHSPLFHFLLQQPQPQAQRRLCSVWKSKSKRSSPPSPLPYQFQSPVSGVM